MSTRARSGVLQVGGGKIAHQGAAGVGGGAVAVAAEQGVHRLVERLALQVPQRQVDSRHGQGENAAGPGAAGRSAQLVGDALDVQRVLAHHEGAQRLDGFPQRLGQRAAEEGQPDARQPVVGAQFKGDELARGVANRQPDHQGIISRRAQHPGLHVRYVHVVGSSSRAYEITAISRVMSGRRGG